MKKIYLFCLSLFLTMSSQAHDWTYYTKVTVPASTTNLEMLLWIPDTASYVKGIILCSEARLSQIAGSKKVRAMCAEENLAIIGFRGDFTASFDPANLTYFQRGFDSLAKYSKFPEISYAPICTYGSSVGSLFATAMPYVNPARFFGIIMDVGLPQAPPSWATQSIIDVPIISMRGEYEPVGDRWMQTRDSIIARRGRGYLTNVTVLAGGGHFTFTEDEEDYYAIWIKKAALARITVDCKTVPITLGTKKIVEASGWLTDTTFNQATIQMASYSNYTGNKSKAYWHFDQEEAQAWIDFHQGRFTKTGQNVTHTGCSSFAFSGTCATITVSSTGNYFIAKTNPAILNGSVITVNSGISLRANFYDGPFFKRNDSIFYSPAMIDYVDQAKTTRGGWITFYNNGDATHRTVEKAFKYNITKNTNGATTISFSGMTDKLTNASPFSYTANAGSGQIVKSWIVAGAIKKTGNQYSMEKYAKGTSKAVIKLYTDGGGGFGATTTVNDDFDISKFEDTVRSFVCIPTALAETTPESYLLIVYPNPAQSSITVKLAPLSDVQVYNVLGEIVYQEFKVAGDIQIPLAAWSTGVYTIKVQSGGKTLTQRLIKE